MNVIVFGATGMVGQGVLRECLLDPGVERVLTIGRKSTGQTHAKLRELIVPDMHNLSSIDAELAAIDACFFCLGITSVGMNEADYKRITYDIAVDAARRLLAANAKAKFVFVSGSGADSTEKANTMWARVKGAAENAILKMPFAAAFVFRPALIQPLHGITSRTRAYRIFLVVFRPIFPVLRRVFPGAATTTELIGRAMLNVTRHGYSTRVLHTREINDAAK